MISKNLRQIGQRIVELDELYLSLWKVSGFTPEQLLEMFMAGYTLKSPESTKLSAVEHMILKKEEQTK